VGSPDIAQTSLTGLQSGFSTTFAPYSASVMVLVPSAPSLQTLHPVPPGKFTFQLQGQSGARYLLQYSTDLANWSNWSTNTLSGSTATFTNFISGPQLFWRAVWQP
jgi:hypothetical protein